MNYTHTQDDFQKLYEEQLLLLKSACQDYDTKNQAFAKQIAILLRSFLHTGSSTALLGRVNKRKNFSNTARKRVSAQNFNAAEALLIGTNVSSGSYEPLYSSNNSNAQKIEFNAWWKMPILISQDQKITLSREELIKYMSNQDGIAHVDKKLDAKYAHFSKHNGFNTMEITGVEMPSDGSMPKTLAGKNVKTKYIPIVEYASIRQIAHEVLDSINEQIPTPVQSDPVIGSIFLR